MHFAIVVVTAAVVGQRRDANMWPYLSVSVLTSGLLLASAAVSAGQEPPPIGGVTGTIALEGTVQKTYEGAHTVAVKTVDGIEHLFHVTDRTVVHGGAAAGDQALRSLHEGSRVVVHYTAEGDSKTAEEVDRIAGDGLHAIEGVITNVDRRAKTMTIRLADGSRQTLHLTERAASDVGRDVDDATRGTATAVIYYDDQAGRRVAHYFKRQP
jgi:hypothetical protein